MKKFAKWTIEEVIDTFHLSIARRGEGMDFWLKAPFEANDWQKEQIQILRNKLIDFAGVWNEEELKVNFIAGLFLLVEFEKVNVPPFSERKFLEREIEVTINNVKIAGNVDWMLAEGYGRPKTLYFCLKEFKRKRYSSNDPEGQLAISMLAAQTLNKHNGSKI